MAFHFAETLLTALTFLLSLEVQNHRYNDRIEFLGEKVDVNNELFDYIVVGAGTAGCVIAARLSEFSRVALLEVGGITSSGVEVPGLFDYVKGNPDINYFYKSKPQAGANNRVFTKSHGKILGGSGSNNALIHNRGHKQDYDNWAELVDDKSWKYKEMLQYFKKAETYSGKDSDNEGSYGGDGPINIETDTERPILPIWKKAAEELNYVYTYPNGNQKEGFAPSELAVKDGRRQSTFATYIRPIKRSRTSLKVIKFANVTEITFDGKRATGVKYNKHGVEKILTANEVILSAGVFGTPLLLLKSGIGPSDDLEEAGINVVHDSPAVGKYLQDHPGVPLGPITVDDPSYLSTVENNLTELDWNKYLQYKKVPILGFSGLGPQGFFLSSNAREDEDSKWPDIQMYHINNNFGSEGKSAAVAEIKDKESSESDKKSDKIQPPIYNHIPANTFYIAIVVARPKLDKEAQIKINTKAYKNGERANTKIASIDYRFMKSPEDKKVLLDGIKLAMKILSTKAFKQIGTKLQPHSECQSKHEFNSDEYWDCFISTVGTTWYHSVGTCRMGSTNNKEKSVVNSKLQVFGVTNLRIVDASIMPQIVNVNPNAAIIAIAEKLADEIRSSASKTGSGVLSAVGNWFGKKFKSNRTENN